MAKNKKYFNKIGNGASLPEYLGKAIADFGNWPRHVLDGLTPLEVGDEKRVDQSLIRQTLDGPD